MRGQVVSIKCLTGGGGQQRGNVGEKGQSRRREEKERKRGRGFGQKNQRVSEKRGERMTEREGKGEEREMGIN
jgi:hypothetical protein